MVTLPWVAAGHEALPSQGKVVLGNQGTEDPNVEVLRLKSEDIKDWMDFTLG